MATCRRCGGQGRIEHYRHVEGGVCFRCRGTGIEPGTHEPYVPAQAVSLRPTIKVTVTENTPEERLAYLQEWYDSGTMSQWAQDHYNFHPEKKGAA